jgi:type I restriction enzyme R subunit
MEEYANEKVVFLIDECHRSQFGKMHKDVKGFFKKAQYFGFTGTPIFKENAKKEGEIQYITETLFGKPLHQYMIKQAIADGNVLGFKIEYMKTIVAKNSVYEQKLNENEAASSSTEVSAIDTAEAWNDERRIEAVCKNIIQNFKAKTVNKNYNAILATSGVENLIKYYDTFKRLNPDFTFAAVFTYDVNEDAESKEETSQDAMARIIDDYNAKFGTSFKTDTFAEYNEDLSKKFKANKINLLIVVRMYLTGCNSKILNTLYVDKNLVYQDLLQSYSRTNRTEKATKKFGNIVCYRNLKYNTDQALKLYSNSASTEGIVQKSFEYYLDRLQTALGMLWQVAETPQDAANLQSETEQKKFILAFREVIRLITTLKTFEEFEFDEALIGISEEDFDNFKSQYLDIHKNLSRRDTAEKASILDEVDFQIELLETDVINVDYILTLLKNVDMTNPQQKEKDITEIFDKIKKSANPTLRKKSDLIIAFIQSLIDGLKMPEDLEDRFRSFEEKAKQEEITKFANEHDLTYKELNAVFEEYEFDGILNNDSIKNLIHKEMGFLELSKVVKEIKLFIIEISYKYSSEMAV